MLSTTPASGTSPPRMNSTRTVVATVATVAALLTALEIRRRRNAKKRAAADFERRCRALHGNSRAPCIIDAAPHLVYHFAIGSFRLVEADLRRALSIISADAAISALVESGVRKTFAVRREIVHFKKACLLVLQEVLRVERGLVRQQSFFYREQRRCEVDQDGCECERCCAWRTSRRRELAFCRRGDVQQPTEGDEDDADSYLGVCEWLQSVRGLRVALQDARGLLKTLCLLQRFVKSDDEIHQNLRDMVGGFAACGLAERAVTDAATCSASGDKDEALAKTPLFGVRAQLMGNALDGPMASLPPTLPDYETQYIRQSLFARGLPKATAQAEGGKQLAKALRRVQQRSAFARERVEESLRRQRGAEAPSSLDCDLVAALRFEMKLGRHVRTLRTLSSANDALLATLEHVGDENESVQSASFVAGDTTRGEHAMWYPAEFAPILALLHTHKAAHDRYEKLMRNAMVVEGWPPPPSTRRTRVHEGGPLPCRVCAMSYSRLWQEKGVCWKCEQRLREAGQCPFGAAASSGRKKVAKGRRPMANAAEMETTGETTGQAVVEASVDAAAMAKAAKAAAGVAKAHPFCPHQSLCAACDPGFASCEACRLSQGDGEAVLCAISSWRPSKLFLDFDLTLCTTRGGANPLIGDHTVDADLQAAADAMGGAATHVLTRNRHTAQIATFLEERGVRIAGVHTTPSGTSKADYMRATLEEGERALFVDDAAAEIGDERIAEDERVFRVLFTRW